MICYPLATLMSLNIKEILIISTVQDTPNIKKFLGNGLEYGINISYLIQENPKGIAEAFLVGERFIGGDPVSLILGDNIFYGSEIDDGEFKIKFNNIINKKIGAYIFAYHVSDPERYGVVEFDNKN